MAVYPAVFDVTQPEKYDRMQILLRIVVYIVFAVVLAALSFAGPFGILFSAVGLVLPVAAAVLISQKGAERYLAEADGNVVKWLRWAVRLYSWFLLLSDKFPTLDGDHDVRFEVRPTGSPTIGSALLRIITVIPHAIVLFFIGFVAIVIAFIAAIMILIQEAYPAGMYGFLRGYMRWWARVAAWEGSLVGEYPPFALDNGNESAGASLPPPPPPAQPQQPGL